jgi:hypothetical protein
MDRKISVAIKIAKEKGLNFNSLSLSTANNKRFSIRSPSGKLINFGQWPFSGKGAFIDHGDEKIKEAWRARHSKIMKQGKPAYLNPESPEYYSWNILW